MDLLEYVRTLRRRWILVAVCVVVTVGGALATMAESPAPEEEGADPEGAFAARYFVAARDPFRLETLGVLAQSDLVVARAAERLELDSDPDEAPARLATVAIDGKRGLLIFRASDVAPERAVEIVSAYAREAMEYVDERMDEQLAAEAESLTSALVGQQDAISALNERLESASPESLEARLAQTELDSAVGAYTRLQGRLIEVRAEIVASPLYTFEPGVAAPEIIEGETGDLRLGVATGGRARLLYGLGLGLLLGLGVAFGAEHLDTRINNRREAARAFGVPVVAEVPRLRRFSLRRTGAVEGYEPALADAYGRLRVALLHMPRWIPVPSLSRPSLGNTANTVEGPAALGLTNGTGVVVVTSATRGEGRTATVINLAASLAAAGKKVAVVDCDHQNPSLSSLLPGSSTNGSVDVAREWSLCDSSVPGVKLVPAPSGVSAGDRSAAAQRVIQTALERVDLVVVDTGPILSTIDATSLVPHCDAVVLVARAGRVTEEEATEVRDLLANLHAPVTGVALIATRSRASTSGGPPNMRPTLPRDGSDRPGLRVSLWSGSGAAGAPAPTRDPATASKEVDGGE